MAMTPKGMAQSIISETDQCTDPAEANNKFYKGICNHVEEAAQVVYAWAGVNPSGTPDPQVVLDCKIKTSGSLSPSGATDCTSALAALSAALNAAASTWIVEFPAGFSLSPAFVIPTISLSPSMATDRDSAIEAICAQIIAGLKLCTPTAAGAHAAYTGTATFTQLI